MKGDRLFYKWFQSEEYVILAHAGILMQAIHRFPIKLGMTICLKIICSKK
jgi:hypothetical protein